jgi:hypothetical protein
MNSEIKGMEELQNNLDNLAKRAEQLHGSHDIPLRELLTPSFMAACSRFAAIDEMLDASGFKIESADDFKAIPESERNAFVKNNTSFDGWQDMLRAAVAEWSKKKLGLE